MEKAQIQNAAKEVLTSIHTVLATLKGERKRLAKEINNHVDRYPNLKQDRKLLESIPGIGKGALGRITGNAQKPRLHQCRPKRGFRGLDAGRAPAWQLN